MHKIIISLLLCGVALFQGHNFLLKVSSNPVIKKEPIILEPYQPCEQSIITDTVIAERTPNSFIEQMKHRR
jgi:hypothetical protein